MNAFIGQTNVNKISLATLHLKYGGNQRRAFLINELVRELRAIRRLDMEYRVYIFGSMLNISRRNPGDIDILLSIVRSGRIPRWKQITKSKDVQIIISDASYFLNKLKPKSAHEMIWNFNITPNNRKMRISIKSRNVVELI